MFTLGRKIELSYKPNQMIVIVTLLTAIFGWMLTGLFLSGLSIGAGVFSTWALSRELDPKHEYSAFVATALSLLLLLTFDSIQFSVIAWLLLLLRMTNGITGKKLTAIDIVSVLILTIYLSLNEENSFYLIPFIAAMVLLIKTKEKTRLTTLAGATALVFFIAETFFMNYLPHIRIAYTDPLTLFVIAILFLSFIVFWFISKGECKDDKGNSIKRARLLTTQLLFSMTIFCLFLFGNISLTNLIIYLSILIGITLYFTLYKILKKLKNNTLEAGK